MTFKELELLIVIKEVDDFCVEHWTAESRLIYAKRVASQWSERTGDVLFPFDVDKVIQLTMKIRKNKSTRMKALIAKQHGSTCFWVGRNKGPCSNEAEAGHLVPKCRGGELDIANSIIECRNHNNQRREMTIEEYLLAAKRTVAGEIEC